MVVGCKCHLNCALPQFTLLTDNFPTCVAGTTGNANAKRKCSKHGALAFQIIRWDRIMGSKSAHFLTIFLSNDCQQLLMGPSHVKMERNIFCLTERLSTFDHVNRIPMKMEPLFPR